MSRFLFCLWFYPEANWIDVNSLNEHRDPAGRMGRGGERKIIISPVSPNQPVILRSSLWGVFNWAEWPPGGESTKALTICASIYRWTGRERHALDLILHWKTWVSHLCLQKNTQQPPHQWCYLPFLSQAENTKWRRQNADAEVHTLGTRGKCTLSHDRHQCTNTHTWGLFNLAP